MSNALIKARENNDGTLSVSENRRKMHEALARIAKLQIEARAIESPSAIAAVSSPGEAVDLPRICAVHDMPYVARYVLVADNRLRHSQTIKVTEALYLSQYADSLNQRRLLNGSDLDEEFCPWCGGHGFGSVLCGRCGLEVCYGKTTQDYFRCRDSCGGRGTIFSKDGTQEGIAPQRAGRSGVACPTSNALVRRSG